MNLSKACPRPSGAWSGVRTRLLVYWFLFAFHAAGALLGRVETGIRRSAPLLALGAVSIALLIGFRYRVGADWISYEFMFSYLRYADVDRALEFGDPAYQLLSWSVQQVGGELWLVNLICGAIFAWGLLRFARVQPDPWLGLLVAIPYLVIVVAMGYSRQAVAIGILMAGLASSIRGGSTLRFTMYVVAAALFHRTAVVALPLVALAADRNRLINFLVFLASSVALYDAFLQDSMEQFVKSYIETEYSSQGAAIRVVMNLLPAVLFLLFADRLPFTTFQRKLWRNYSYAAVGLLALLLLLPSSTAVDRIALYVMPLQIAVLSRVPGTLATVRAGKMMVVAYCFAVQFTWLNYAAHAQHWVPYQFFPLS